MKQGHNMNFIIAVGALTIAFSTAFMYGDIRWFNLAPIDGSSQSGSVGVGAGVEPNEFNTLARQVEEKERELDAREKEIIVREREVERVEYVETTDRGALVYTTIIGLILLALILLNFLMDIRRNRNEREET